MTALLKKIIKKIFGKYIDLSLPIQLVLFNIIVITGIMGVTLSLFICIFSDLPVTQTVSIGAGIIILLICFYLSNYKNMLQLSSFALCFLVTVILFPLMFFANGGIQSGMPFWFAIGILFTFLLNRGIVFWSLLCIELIVHTACFVIAYYYPKTVLRVEEMRVIYIDVWQCMMILVLVIGIISKFQIEVYDRINKKVEYRNDQLLMATAEAEVSKEEALRANKAKTHFLANMSHEIRTPINAILGMDEMILRECKDKQVLTYAENIQDASRQLLSLINDILDFSKLESGKMEIVNVQYDVSSVIHDCFNMVNERAKEKQLNFVVDCAEDIPKTLYGDEVRLRQIIVNLLTNAIKYTREGEVHLKLKIDKVSVTEILLVIEVEDTGIGLKEKELGKLFDSFERLDPEKNHYIEGTGLGLAVVKQIVELLHGKIYVDSTYGVGSKFTVQFLQQVIDWTPHTKLAGRYKYVEETNQTYHPQFIAPDAKILIVDDVPMNLTVAKNLLKGLQLQIDTAQSGSECLEMVTKKMYHMIFMDHMMPEMDGIETFHKLERMPDSLNKNVPVIMLTANAISGVKERYISEGFADYLSKPMRSADLEYMIERYLPKELILGKDETEEMDMGTDCMVYLEQNIPQMNTSVGLSYCGDMEDIYIEVLQEYYEKNCVKAMTECFEKKDWENYRIHVHSLKSTSLTVGLEELSEFAKKVEFAVKAEDYDFAIQNHVALLAEYQEVLDKMGKIVTNL